MKIGDRVRMVKYPPHMGYSINPNYPSGTVDNFFTLFKQVHIRINLDNGVYYMNEKSVILDCFKIIKEDFEDNNYEEWCEE